MKYYIYITPFFPSPNDWRGAYGLDFVKALERELLAVSCPSLVEKWRVVVFKPGDGSDYTVDGVTVHTFKEWKLPSGIFPFFFRRHNERAFLAKVHTILTANNQPLTAIFICHANTAEFAIYPLALKRINPNCKTLLHHHDLQSFGLNGGMLRHCWIYNLYLFPALRQLHEQMDYHIFISEASRRSFLLAPNTDWTDYADYKKQMGGLPYRPVRIKRSLILHNGVDTSIFHPSATNHQSLTANHSDFVIGCVGNFDALKEQMTLLKAVVVLTQNHRVTEKIKVVFVGSGEKLDECRRFAADHGIDAEFRDEVRHEKLAEFYRKLDLFVLPSVFEGFGCVYTEAWACGVPFIACEGQGVEDVIRPEDRHVWLAKKHDAEDLTEKIDWYRTHRSVQILADAVDLPTLVSRFAKELVK